MIQSKLLPFTGPHQVPVVVLLLLKYGSGFKLGCEFSNNFISVLDKFLDEVKLFCFPPWLGQNMLVEFGRNLRGVSVGQENTGHTVF